ncbi:unnamed protein product [Protopolystoma xenopodis]|uniref:Uncharacterized protein n=1 Tax=Protopolystoma xenopodis TaxID=117903 RepID=A0A3S5CQ27_9PLAT|nr:unnamed protein product [Protopolystoma xenopodis]
MRESRITCSSGDWHVGIRVSAHASGRCRSCVGEGGGGGGALEGIGGEQLEGTKGLRWLGVGQLGRGESNCGEQEDTNVGYQNDNLTSPIEGAGM